MDLPRDWQIDKQKISERGQYLLETGKWSDCKFILGQEPHQETLKGHKLFLAMSSPVFEAMFFGGMAEKNDLIPIRDVQPEAFKALMEYIYTDRIHLGSFELACEVCYCAKKYMLPLLVEECTKYIWSDLCPKKACRAYEFAKLFDEPVLMDRCLQIICTRTNEVLKESSWEDVELGTLLLVLDQEDLQVSSEIELFSAVERWAKAESTRRAIETSDGKSLKAVIGNALSKIRFLSVTPQEFAEGPGMSPLLSQDEAFAILMNILCTGNKAPMPDGFSTDTRRRAKPLNQFRNIDVSVHPTFLRSKYRLVMYGGGDDNLFGMNSPSTSVYRHPAFINENKSLNALRSSSPVHNSPPCAVAENIAGEGPKYCCSRSVMEEMDCLNTDLLDCSVAFSVDKNICVQGVQVPTQISRAGNGMNHGLDGSESYTEVLYAHLLDSDDTRLTYTHFTTKVNVGTLVEIAFNRPVYIQKHKIYRVGVVFNKIGCYPVGVCKQHVQTCDSVVFSFGIGKRGDNTRDGLIRGIVFTHH